MSDQAFNPDENPNPDRDKNQEELKDLASAFRRDSNSAFMLEWVLAEHFDKLGLTAIELDRSTIKEALSLFVDEHLRSPNPGVVYYSDAPLIYQDRATGEVHFYIDIAALDVSKFLLVSSPEDPLLQVDEQSTKDIKIASAALAFKPKALSMPRYMLNKEAIGIIGSTAESAWAPDCSGMAWELKSIRPVFSNMAVTEMLLELKALEAEFHKQKGESQTLAVFEPSHASYLLGAIYYSIDAQSKGIIYSWNDLHIEADELLHISLNFLPDISENAGTLITTDIKPETQHFLAHPMALPSGDIDLGLKRVALPF